MTKRFILVSLVLTAFLAGAVLAFGQDVPKSADKKVTEVKAEKTCACKSGTAMEHKCAGTCANHKEGEKECACKKAGAVTDSTACVKVENKDCCKKK